MDLQLKDQVAVVVGGASGIGRATVESFAAEGAYVAVVDINPDCEAVCTQIGDKYGVKFLSACIDVVETEQLASFANELIVQLGRCDHVVVAFGKSSGKYGFPFWNLNPEDWDEVLRVNILGAVNVLHALGPAMRKARSGSISIISSVAGQIGSQTDPPYSAAKAALINFAQCAAKDFAPYNIRVNTVCPGMVKTPLNRSVWEAWARNSERKLSYEEWGAEKTKQVAPLGRWQLAEEIAATIAFLASHYANNITGQTINVDGGQVMRG